MAVLERKRMRRTQLQSYLAHQATGCVVAMEACGSAHHWARLATGHGHKVLLMSPQFVAPYVKSNKNDVNDADAIAEASARPSMRFVGVKSVGQEHIQQLHRARQMAVRNRVAQSNQIHGFLLEYGVEAPKGVVALLRRLCCKRCERTSAARRCRVQIQVTIVRWPDGSGATSQSRSARTVRDRRRAR